jgi:hypothetical protein
MEQHEPTRRRAHSVPEVARRIGVSESLMWAEVGSGECESILIGDRRLITEEQETRYLERKAERARQKRDEREAARRRNSVIPQTF